MRGSERDDRLISEFMADNHVVTYWMSADRLIKAIDRISETNVVTDEYGDNFYSVSMSLVRSIITDTYTNKVIVSVQFNEDWVTTLYDIVLSFVKWYRRTKI